MAEPEPNVPDPDEVQDQMRSAVDRIRKKWPMLEQTPKPDDVGDDVRPHRDQRQTHKITIVNRTTSRSQATQRTIGRFICRPRIGS
jgi:hypothetical protein